MMENLVVINAIGLSPFTFENFGNGKSSFDMVIAYVRSLPGVHGYYIFTDGDITVPEEFTVIRYLEWTVRLLLHELLRCMQGRQNIFYCYGDTPFLNPSITQRMFENHRKYFSHYSFADGYPYGMAPEIIQSEGLEMLAKLGENNEGPVERDTLFTIIQKDINTFDLDTEIAPVDLRMLRISLSADSKRNFAVLRAIVDQGIMDEDGILKTLLERQELLRTYPAYYNIQLTARCPYACSYCPYPYINPGLLNDDAEMSVDRLDGILEKISGFSDDAVIGYSLWGEPAFHSGIYDILTRTAGYDRFRICLETSGLGWDRDSLKAIKDRIEKKTMWIVSLDANDRQQYEKLRGQGLEKVTGFISFLMDTFGSSVYVQAVRMRENETRLDSFYKEWHAKTENVIIQKYDYFCGFLPQLKVTDISPLKRQACWHLKRDLAILVNGDVPMCRDDVKAETILGNIFRDPLEVIWENGRQLYSGHLKGEYPALCRECDEYYTYNF